MTADENVTMSRGELATLIESKLAEHAEAKRVEAERIRESQYPTTPPAPPISAPPELVAELTKALVASRGDVERATLSILARLSVDINQRPTDPKFQALFNDWKFARDVVGPGLRAGLIKNVLTNIERQRERVA